MSTTLYQQELMEHYKHSTFRGKIEDADIFSDEFNPSCGDRISIFAKIDSSKICDIRFMGSGCVLSQASASILSEYVLGKKFDDISNISKDNILELIGMELGPNRLKCALLSLDALKHAISKLK